MATKLKTSDLEILIGEIRAELAALSARVARLEPAAGPAVAAKEVAKDAAPVAAAVAAPAVPESIGEEELLAISAALAAYFGVRVHVRQIRLITNSAWAQQGRVSIQASHRLF